jgi:hypothetical protein
MRLGSKIMQKICLGGTGDFPGENLLVAENDEAGICPPHVNQTS